MRLQSFRQSRAIAGLKLGTIAFGSFIMTLAAHASPNGGPVGVFEAHADIGSPKLAGNATYNAATQAYRLTAGGYNVWFERDEMHFAWRTMRGDFILQARTEFVGSGVDPHRKAGVMIRQGIEEDAPYVDAVVHGDGLTSLQFRRTKGGETEQVESTVKGADVIQIERRGDTYTVSVARFGDPYSNIEIADLQLDDEVQVGLFLSSHNADVSEQVIFRDVRLTRTARPDFTPYRDYIGSRLELLDVRTGHRQVIFSSQQPFEAPNWTPDGTALIYNTSGANPDTRGRLYRFDLASRQPRLIDTGFALRNNNDHVLSFDGKMMGISDQSTDKGESTIFTLPATGGVPKRITPLTPSYLHGWSPDGKFLVYTGGRNGEFDIYKIPSDGSGPEVRLTTAKGVDDGPEFTPDGKYIYFNSVRSGKMQI